MQITNNQKNEKLAMVSNGMGKHRYINQMVNKFIYIGDDIDTEPDDAVVVKLRKIVKKKIANLHKCVKN